MKSLVSSSDENASDQDSNMDKYDVYSKDNKVCELKNSGYMKQKIISVIKKSLKTNNNKHSLTLNDVSVSEEKEIGNGCRQSLNIRIALDDKLFYSSGDTAAGPINIDTFKLNDSTAATTKCCSHCSNKELKSEETWPAYFACVKCGRKQKRKWYHENCKEKCCVATSIYCDNCLRFKLTSIDHNFEVLDNKFAKYMYVVTCPNGGGISLHMDYERIMHFTEDEQQFIAKEFLKEAFKEDKKGFAQFTIAIVHNGASYMPDLLKLLSELHPTLPVKTTKLKCNTETEVMDLGTYYTKVKETYSNGTFAFNPLNEIQAASVKNDECGAYLPELLSLLEKSAFLTQVLPWSDMTTKRFKSPHESDDGPIFWCRPGEQIVSLDRNSKRNRWNADEIESFLKERQQNLKDFCEKRYIVEELKKYRRSYSSREVLFEDRTRPHADQVWGNHFECTAAVGVIQAIHPDEIPEQNRACKEIVVFQAKHFEMLEALLHIDVTAAPKQQCAEWLDDAKLNMIRQMNIKYSKLHLYDNDIYFIPRKIVHQFKTISATLSVAWHTRLIEYYLEPDPPPVSEPAEGSDAATTSTAIKKEQLSDDGNESSSSCSSDSLPPPGRKRKTPTATPKKRRKLSCTRSTASTDNEATPRKRKKPRSRSTTPMKRAAAEKTPKKRVQKTPKKALVLDEEPQEENQEPAPAPKTLQRAKRSPSPEPQSQPAPTIPQPEEKAPSSRSSSPVAVAAAAVVTTKIKKEPRSKSPLPTKKRDSDVSDRVESRKSRSRSPSQAKKLDDDESGQDDVRKSRSKSPSRTKKRVSDGSEAGESRKSSSKSPSRSKKGDSDEICRSEARKSRSKSPPCSKKGDDDEICRSEARKSRSKSPSSSKKGDNDETSQAEAKKSRSKSPPQSKKHDSDEKSHCEVRKSRSKSPLSTKKCDSNDTGEKERKKKKKHRPRSRSRSRKHSNTTPPDKDRIKSDISESKSSGKKKKKDRSRSKSPKKSDKSKDTAAGSSTAVKSSKKSKKHDDQPKSSTASETEKQHHRKKHRSDKDKRSPKRREREKTPTTAPTVSSAAVQEVKQASTEVESRLKSPPSSLRSLSTEKCVSPSLASSADDGSPSKNIEVPTATTAETDQEDIVTTVEDPATTASSPSNTDKTTDAIEESPPASPSPIREPEERAPTPPASPNHIKPEPNSPEVPVKKESLESVISSLAAGLKDEPGSATAPVPDQAPETQQKDTTAKSAPEKPVVQSEKPAVKKPVTSSSSTDPTSRKEHRKKEKLWDTPLFMPQDCDKYAWTKKKSSAPPVVSNRATITKNGDKIVKQKTLNSISNNNINKTDEKNDTANITKPARSRSRSRSPPPWIKKKERKQDDDKLCPPPEPQKKPTNSNDKRGNVEKDKSASSSSGISSEKHRDKEKKSEHKRNKESASSASKKDTERSSASEKKKSSSSSHTKDNKSTNSSQSSEKSAKDRNHEKRKRSRSPSEKRHRDKNSSSSSPPHSSSSSSKKHKKHRSKSRDRTDTASEKPKNTAASNTEQEAPATSTTIAATSTETVSLKNPQDAELAANYKLMIPRVEIVDIGAKYKKTNKGDAATGTENPTESDVEKDTADVEPAAATNADDRSPSDEANDQTPMETDQNATENVSSSESDTQRDE